MTPGTRARMPALVIVNPVAAGGAARQRWQRLASAGTGLEVVQTNAPGDTARHVRAALANSAREVAIFGGDGTLVEAVEGALGSGAAQPCLTYLGGGTSCDFLKRLPFGSQANITPLSVQGARGPPRHPLGAVSMGLTVTAAERLRSPTPLHRLLRRCGPDWAGLVAGARAIRDAHSFEARIVCGANVLEGRFSNLWICAHGTVMGAMRLFPASQCRDGLLAVIAVRARSRAGLVAMIPALYTNRFCEHKAVHRLFGPSVTVTTPQKRDLEGDGEPLGQTPVVVGFSPQTLRIRAESPQDFIGRTGS